MKFDNFKVPWDKFPSIDNEKVSELLNNNASYNEFNRSGATSPINRLCELLAIQLMKIQRTVPKSIQEKVVNEVADKFPKTLKQPHPITGILMPPYNMFAVLKGRIKREHLSSIPGEPVQKQKDLQLQFRWE